MKIIRIKKRDGDYYIASTDGLTFACETIPEILISIYNQFIKNKRYKFSVVLEIDNTEGTI